MAKQRKGKMNRSKNRSIKRKRVQKQMLLHLFFVVVVILVCLIPVIYNLVRYQIRDTKDYQKKVLNQQKYSSTTLYYKRGDILDRKGTYLATSTKIYNLVLEPKNIITGENYTYKEKGSKTEKSYRDITVDALYEYFPFKHGEIEDLLKEKSESYYCVVLQDLSYDDVKDYMEYRKTGEGKCVIGVQLQENYERSYPNGSAACQVIGYTSSGNVGNWGLEDQYNDVLNGTDGRQYSYMNDEGAVEMKVQDAKDGHTIVSTIDLNVQNVIDKQVAEFMKSVGAKNVSVLAMDPNNGEVLGMSNSAVYDLNDPFNADVLKQIFTDEELEKMSKKEKLDSFNEVWRNRVITDTYEPGSTFKPFTMSAALEEAIVSDGDVFYCNGIMEVGDHKIRCHNTDGMIDIEHAIAKSCNVAMMQINAALGAKQFTRYQSIFGFGQYTNIDLPGEASAESLIYSPDKIGPTDLATNSFGQGFNCTMIQLATGFCSLINGGNYYEPHMVKEIRNAEGGTVETIEKKLVKKTVSKSTSKLIKKYLKTVVDEGTGTGCQIAGYELGGKTGTAEKLPRNNGKYLLSFITFAPYDTPQIVLYVTIDEINLSPQDQTSYAVHLVRKIMKQLLPYLGVEQAEISEEEEQKQVVNVNESGQTISGTDDASSYLDEDTDSTAQAEETTESTEETVGETATPQPTNDVGEVAQPNVEQPSAE